MFVNRRLYRCSHDRRIAGVAAGLAEYFDLDPTLMRVLWFVSIFFTGGLAILLYRPLDHVLRPRTHPVRWARAPRRRAALVHRSLAVPRPGLHRRDRRPARRG